MRPTSRIAAIGALALASLAGLACSAAAGDTPIVQPEALLAATLSDEKILVLDVRTPAEYQSGHVPGAVNIPVDQLESRIDEVRTQQSDRIVVYCERGGRAGKAEETLRAAGVENVQHLSGDMQRWRSLELPQEPATKAPSP